MKIVQAILLFLVCAKPVESRYPSTVVALPTFGGELMAPTSCTEEEESIIVKEYFKHVVQTQTKPNIDFFVIDKPGNFSDSAPIAACMPQGKIGEFQALLAQTAKKLSPACRNDVLQTVSLECRMAYLDYDYSPEASQALEGTPEMNAVGEEEGEKSAHGGGRKTQGVEYCNEWCLSICWLLMPCYCQYVDWSCLCCNCLCW